MDAAFVKEVLSIVRVTRDLSFPHFGTAAIESQKSENQGSVVTGCDLAVEEYLAKHLPALDGTPLVGEEYGGDREAQRFWLCDPIDGTGCFVRGLPFSTTMLALIDDGKPALSVIYDFVRDELYYAVAGGGAYRDGEAIRVNERSLKDAYLFYETNFKKDTNYETFLRLRRRAPTLFTLSAGYEFAMVASGKMEGRISKDPYGNDYDFVPGCLLVAEAGGVVKNIGMDSYDYRNLDFIAATPAVYEDLTSGSDALFPIS